MIRVTPPVIEGLAQRAIGLLTATSPKNSLLHPIPFEDAPGFKYQIAAADQEGLRVMLHDPVQADSAPVLLRMPVEKILNKALKIAHKAGVTAVDQIRDLHSLVVQAPEAALEAITKLLTTELKAEHLFASEEPLKL